MVALWPQIKLRFYLLYFHFKSVDTLQLSMLQFVLQDGFSLTTTYYRSDTIKSFPGIKFLAHNIMADHYVTFYLIIFNGFLTHPGK